MIIRHSILGRPLLTALVLITFAVASRAAFQATYVEGSSMLPTLHPSQLMLVQKVAFSPKRGDLVVFKSPVAPSADFVKRVVGLPGDSVLVQVDQVFVNGRPLEESYVRFPARYIYPPDGQPLVVPDDAYFVLGDNRPESVDSHLGWFVPRRDLIGQAIGLPWSQPAAPTADVTASGLDQPMTDVTAAPVDQPAPASRPAIDLGTAAPQWARGRLIADESGWLVTREAPLPGIVTDVEVSATFTKTGGPPRGTAGLLARGQSASEYYSFELRDDGLVSVWRRHDHDWTELLPWTNCAAVRPGGSPNELTARVVGNELSLLVNGTPVASVRDPTFPGGSAGVFVEGPSNEVVFEGFAVRPVEASAGKPAHG